MKYKWHSSLLTREKAKIGQVEAFGRFGDIVDVVGIAEATKGELNGLRRPRTSSCPSFESLESFETAQEEPQLPHLSAVSVNLEGFRIQFCFDSFDRQEEVASLDIGEANFSSSSSQPRLVA